MKTLLSISLLLAGAASAQASPATPPSLLEQLVAASRDVRYQPPSQQEFEQAQAVFYRLLTQPASVSDQALARLGFALRSLDATDEHLLIIEDKRRRGGGFYVLRQEDKPRHALLLEAPHSFYDRGTRQLAVQWLCQRGVVAAAWNTAPRHQLPDDQADLAHQDVSFFQAFTLAFARAYPHGGIVQLHGFSQFKRHTEAGWHADAIISNGTAKPSQIVWRIDRCLDDVLAGGSKLYPDEVRELGATTNRNARALRTFGFSGFVHLEMSRELRRKLLQVRYLRNQVLQCVREGWA
ncbi:MAG: hypothetical protein D6794_03860 [Deltaproteobacteria bacterium]|nr:MAG: hypothetical protein D6794_03860 [Deltaproteobacteria bacterium]